jgi:hypothetical protein
MQLEVNVSLVAKLHHLRFLVPLSQLVLNLTEEISLIPKSEANVLQIVGKGFYLCT